MTVKYATMSLPYTASINLLEQDVSLPNRLRYCFSKILALYSFVVSDESLEASVLQSLLVSLGSPC